MHFSITGFCTTVTGASSIRTDGSGIPFAGAFLICSDSAGVCNGGGVRMTGFCIGVRENSLGLFALEASVHLMLSELYSDSLTGWYGVIVSCDDKIFHHNC